MGTTAAERSSCASKPHAHPHPTALERATSARSRFTNPTIFDLCHCTNPRHAHYNCLARCAAKISDAFDVADADRLRTAVARLADRSKQSDRLLAFLGVGVTGDRQPLFVGEIAPPAIGTSLEALLQATTSADWGTGGPRVELGWLERRRIAGEVANGLGFLHSGGIVHGDLRLANIFCGVGTNWVKMGGFGLRSLMTIVNDTGEAAALGTDNTGGYRMSGTSPSRGARGSGYGLAGMASATGNANGYSYKHLPWLAPELLSGAAVEVTSMADIFQLGLMLWGLATATAAPPWSGLAVERIAEHVLAGERPAIPAAFAAEHEQYTALTRRCWAQVPADRASSLQVNRFFNTPAHAAPPPTPVYAALPPLRERGESCL